MRPNMVETLWDAENVASYLKVSRSMVYKLGQAGDLPCLRVGARASASTLASSARSRAASCALGQVAASRASGLGRIRCMTPPRTRLPARDRLPQFTESEHWLPRQGETHLSRIGILAVFEARASAPETEPEE